MDRFKYNKKTDDLFRIILSLKDVREARAFFRDLCTIEELKALSDRWEIARLLNEGTTYRDIAEKVEVSTTTVSRVAQWLFNGAGGYRLALERSAHNHSCPSLSGKS